MDPKYSPTQRRKLFYFTGAVRVEVSGTGISTMTTKFQPRALVLFIWVIVSAFGQNLLSCETTSPEAPCFSCSGNGTHHQCGTFAIIRTNSYYSSLFNLSFYLGIDRFVLAAANGLPASTEFLHKDQPLLVPLDCRCNGGCFEAELRKTTIKGESFYGIAESLEGLTTCKAIKKRNPSLSPWGLVEKLQLLIPLRCGCPSPSASEFGQPVKLLLSYPVSQGDTTSNLASMFNTTPEAIILANNRSEASFKPESLVPFSTLLIPVSGKPILGSLAKPSEPSLGFPSTSIPVTNPRKRKSKIWKIAIYVALSVVAVGVGIAFAAAFMLIQWKRKKQRSCKLADVEPDVELQQLNLSVRTTCDKKVSFEGSQNTLDGQIIDAMPRKMMVETYTIEELRKATEDFSSNNLIEGHVFHGRLNGKNLAIKRTQAETVLEIEKELFHGATHHHPNILRLMGTCPTEGPDSFLVFEYAKNGSLKDWLHGGLAMKNQFIASCCCFLTWSQRVRICLDVATALQYMHHIMNPSYVHRHIKSRNIFLDEEFGAKVGNFGMARCAEQDNDSSHSYSTHQAASWGKGYLAPEYLNQGIIAPSIDVFAYGVVLLEVLSGQTPTTRGIEKEEGRVRLSEKIKVLLQSDSAEDLRDWMDHALGDNYSFDAAVTLANLARACVEDDPSSRPHAGEIVDKLSRLVEEIPEAEQFSICESSCKPLVKAAATSM